VVITAVDHTPELEQLKSRSSKRIKEFWKNVRKCKLVVAYLSSLSEMPKDPRPFLPIRLLNRTVYGLLNSGAAISCVGGQLACEVLEKYDYKTIKANASTADGRSQQIVGRLKLHVEYSNVKKPLTIYIIPPLKQNLYLGIDFWRLYDLLPKCKNISKIDSIDSNGKVETDQHDLSETERAKLVNVIHYFPSLLKRVSAEIDNIIQLEIEESRVDM